MFLLENIANKIPLIFLDIAGYPKRVIHEKQVNQHVSNSLVAEKHAELYES